MENESIQRELIAPRLINIPDYQLLEPLGKGSMGSVFRAHNAKMDVDVAIKILNSAIANDQIAQDRFLREAKALAQLSHENIVKVLHSGVADTGEFFYVMEFLDGITLASELETSTTLSSKRFFEIVPQIAYGLAEIHAHKILHRDLKSGNIMLCKNVDGATTVKIIDFGIMRKEAAGDSGASTLTQGNASLGTPSYMSPEQCRGQRASYTSDIFALGCIMYECIAGTPPHIGESLMETFHKRITDPPAKLQIPNHNKKAQQLSELIMRCLQKEPAARPQESQQIGDEINAIFDKGAATPELFRKDAYKTNIACVIAVALGVIGIVAIALLAARSNNTANVVGSHNTAKIALSRRVKELSTARLDGYSRQINMTYQKIEQKKKDRMDTSVEETKLSEILKELDQLLGKLSANNDALRFGILQLRLRILISLNNKTYADLVKQEKESLKYSDSNPEAAAWVRNSIAELYLNQNNAIEGEKWATDALKHLRDRPVNRSEDEIQVEWSHAGGGAGIGEQAHFTLGIANCNTGNFAEARKNFELADASDLEGGRMVQLMERRFNEAKAFFNAGSAVNGLATLKNCLQQINERAPFKDADGCYLRIADSAEKYNLRSLARESLRNGMSNYQADPQIYAKLKNQLQMLN